jgi:hypothetical protein
MHGRTIAAVAATAALGFSAAPAAAQAPPTGKYDCVIGSSSTLFGTLTIKSGSRFSHRGTRGRFTHSGKKLRFRGGTLDRMRGRWYRSSSGRYEIALRNPRDDFESIYCTRR